MREYIVTKTTAGNEFVDIAGTNITITTSIGCVELRTEDESTVIKAPQAGDKFTVPYDTPTMVAVFGDKGGLISFYAGAQSFERVGGTSITNSADNPVPITGSITNAADNPVPIVGSTSITNAANNPVPIISSTSITQSVEFAYVDIKKGKDSYTYTKKTSGPFSIPIPVTAPATPYKWIEITPPSPSATSPVVIRCKAISSSQLFSLKLAGSIHECYAIDRKYQEKASELKEFEIINPTDTKKIYIYSHLDGNVEVGIDVFNAKSAVSLHEEAFASFELAVMSVVV